MWSFSDHVTSFGTLVSTQLDPSQPNSKPELQVLELQVPLGNSKPEFDEQVGPGARAELCSAEEV